MAKKSDEIVVPLTDQNGRRIGTAKIRADGHADMEITDKTALDMLFTLNLYNLSSGVSIGANLRPAIPAISTLFKKEY